MKRVFLDGIVKRHTDGFGFFIPDDASHPDVYIPRQAMTGVMTNDRVRVDVQPEGKGSNRFRGEIQQILSRSMQRILGRFTKAAFGSGLILDEESKWGGNIIIPEGKTMNAEDDQFVVIKITQYPGLNSDMTGEVIEILGDKADPLHDTKRVLLSQNIPIDFSSSTLQEASQLGHEVSENDMKNRRDLRHLDFVTIDGATAKDFDDAIYVEQNSRGFRLLVAIADVSHYVPNRSAIDKDAYDRGTSVYFPNYVVPMLPEALSNELCSLKPNVPRLSVVAEMQMDFLGEPIESDFYEAVIESKARVIYGEAQEIVDGNTPEKLKHVEKAILRSADLAKILMNRRFKEGSLDLEIPDTQIILDDGGNPVDIIRAERLFAHRLIEEMMLAANVAVATYFKKRNIPAIYRIHEEPAADNIEMLNRFLVAFGATKTISGGRIQKKLTRALQAFAGKPQEEVLNILTLRSMKQAKYSAENIGHFGLGFENYTHFTSPIRRYPDLIVHRLLKSLILKSDKYKGMSEDALMTAGTHLSACEQRAVKAERQFKAIKRARFMANFVGKEFDGIISSVAKFGVFVVLRAFDVDGLVKLEDLGGEAFEYDEENIRLIGKRSGAAFTLGDPLKIQVASVDPEQGQINFVVVGEQAVGTVNDRKTNRPNNKKRRKTEDDRRSIRKPRVSKRRRKG